MHSQPRKEQSHSNRDEPCDISEPPTREQANSAVRDQNEVGNSEVQKERKIPNHATQRNKASPNQGTTKSGFGARSQSFKASMQSLTLPT
jgi:hypothetical protein